MTFNPAQGIAETIDSFAPQAHNQAVSWHASYPEGVANHWFEAELMKIRQVIDNLIANALKFTAIGRIEVGYSFEGSNPKMYISDTGKGIPNQEIKKVFERFYQVDTSLNRGHEGVGLGLALFRSMVTLMGGRIWAELVVGEGSVFYFEIPVRVAKETLQPLYKTNEKKVEAISLKNLHYKILVVDVDEPSPMMMKAVLSGIGCHVLLAANGQKALDLLQSSNDFNLVLLDIKMPVMDGIQTLQHIRQLGIMTPVAATTAYALPSDEIRIRRSGFDNYLTKPF